MALTPLTALFGAVAPVAARTTIDVVRQVAEARPFSHVLAAGGHVISAGGEALQQAFSSEEPAPAPETAEQDPLALLREEVQAVTALLASRIEARLGQAGIDLSLPLEFEVTTGGQLSLNSTHPQKEAIEGLLARDPEVGQLATYVEATQRMLHTSDTQRSLLAEEAGRTLGSLERRAAQLAGQPDESLIMKLDRGEIELEYR